LAEYVYGIVSGTSAPPSGHGIAGAPLHLIAGDGAAALVSDLPDDNLRLGREEIVTHARVLEDALGRGTVLPMRFGVVLEGPEQVRERILEGHADELTEQLERFAGKVEVNIRVLYEEEPLMREIVARDPQIARLRSGLKGKPEDATYYDRIRLGELVAAAVERAREADAQSILEVLSQHALAAEVGEPPHERVALSASFLVARERLGAFDAALEDIARGQSGRMRFKYTGPLPPHSFVELAGAG